MDLIKIYTDKYSDKEIQKLLSECSINKDGKIPILKQVKYISVPLTNGYEETLCQEHIIGSKNYELSAQGSTKQLKLKTSKTAV